MSIVINQVSKAYGSQTVLHNITLEIENGELFVLLGASGSGKSTLLRLIAGLIPVDSGQIVLRDRDVTHLPPQKRGTGFVFQNYSLFRHMNVAQNIEFGLSIRRKSRDERRHRVQELLDLIGLPNYGNRMPNQLSGGQQQRVALARALAYNPNVLLLDEPFGALDVKIRAQLRENLREIQQRLRVTTILVTHDQEEAFEVADRIGIIDQGRLLEVGTPSQLYRRPQSHFTATFLGSANLLQAQRNGSFVYIGDTKVPAPEGTEHLAGQSVDLLARPEEIELNTQPTGANGHVIGAGVVETLAFAGPVQRVTVRLNGQHNNQELTAQLSPSELRASAIQPGQKVWVSIKDFHLLPAQKTEADK